ncbi:MAG: LPS export ABC transporter permease LptG [Burkholderiales bacterium]|nr:LPS export ABC transporter permease LptG [Pseudomonadota bacterium]MCC7068850.1 LPS export ABC transporter permease LptG [Burkholderiales bacterium]
MKTLSRYLAREVISATALMLAALLMLWVFYDLLAELGALRALNAGQLLVLVAATIPGHLYELLPVAALIGTLFALAQLAANSEYGVMRTSGVSVWQVGFVLLSVSLVFAGVVFVIGEYVVPRAEQLLVRVRAFSGTRPYVARAFDSGFWFKDGNTFINIGSVLPDGGLRKLRVFEYRDATHLGRTLTAESASFLGGQQWALDRVTETTFGSDVSVVQHERTDWHSVLTPNMLSVLQVEPARLSIGGLWEYINHLNANQQNARRFEVALWGKFVYPLATCVLMLLALPFAQIQQRAGGIGMRIFVGILLGLVFIVGNRLFSYLALLYEWPPFLGAIVPAVIFLVAGTVMLLRLERR